MAYRTVLDILFHALVRYVAPVLVFTSEEVWQTRFPGEDSVHFSYWPEVPVLPEDDAFPQTVVFAGLKGKFDKVRQYREAISRVIEPLRRDKIIGSSLEAQVEISLAYLSDHELFESLDMAEIAICAAVQIREVATLDGETLIGNDSVADLIHRTIVTKTTNHKCGRCWRHLPEVVEDGALCGRCADVVGG
jgi:isoleucyl-tRNA synthetase